MNLSETIKRSFEYIRSITDTKPEIGMILGSGLGDYAQELEDAVYIPYDDIPGFPVSTVQGHSGRFVIGSRKGKTVVAMQGRIHYYEGYSQGEITIPVRIMKLLGVKKLLLTNAAGGVNTDFKVGSLMCISDHINYSGYNPLIGYNLDEFGARFPDVSNVYTKELREELISVVKQHNISLEQGVYMMFSGPSYETPAEIRMARVLGADAVGMSTVPEAIVAAHCGIDVLGISCITNFAAGILDSPLSHEEVVETTTRVHSEFVSLLDVILEEVF